MSTDLAAPVLPDRCARRAVIVGEYAAAYLTAADAPVASRVLSRIVWDAPAAGEFPKAMLADALDAAALWPEHAEAIWHHAAGVTILGPGCCSTPAAHGEALAALARSLCG